MALYESVQPLHKSRAPDFETLWVHSDFPPARGPRNVSSITSIGPNPQTLPPQSAENLSYRNPKRKPFHERLFLLGLLFPPAWWFGAYIRKEMDNPANVLARFRCQMMSVVSGIVVVTLIILAGYAHSVDN